jgi:archaeosine synthase beta-subunit
MNVQEKIKLKTLTLRTKCAAANPCLPRFVESDHYKLNGKIYSRLRIILRSNGCSIPTCTMCPFPNEALDSKIIKVSETQYIQQIEAALKNQPKHEILSVYNDGNFFSDQELPKIARQKIYQIAKEQKCNYLMVESLPCFITQKQIGEAKDFLGEDVKLIVGIGLQSATDEVRQTCIGTAIDKKDFLRAHKLLQKFAYETKCYVIIKPPFLLENEAIEDAVNSSLWLQQNNITDITLCPIRIAPNTLLQELFNCDLYSMPKLITLAECLYQLRQKNVYVRVSIFNISSSDFKAITPSGCNYCENKIMSALIANNNGIDVDFGKVRCKFCTEQINNNDPAIFKDLSYLERIEIALNNFNSDMI